MIFFIWFLAITLAIFLLTVFRGAPYVPSLKRDVERAFSELYELSGDDHLVDIGSGDGIILRHAAQKGAKATGLEVNPILVLISKMLCRKYPEISIRQADFWSSKLPKDTSVVYVFGDGRDINKMGDWVVQQANEIDGKLFFISYGFELEKYQSLKKVGPYSLYRFK